MGTEESLVNSAWTLSLDALAATFSVFIRGHKSTTRGDKCLLESFLPPPILCLFQRSLLLTGYRVLPPDTLGILVTNFFLN
jgi:hypothetical protein